MVQVVHLFNPKVNPHFSKSSKQKKPCPTWFASTMQCPAEPLSTSYTHTNGFPIKLSAPNSLWFKFYTSSTKHFTHIFKSRPKNYHRPTWFPTTMEFRDETLSTSHTRTNGSPIKFSASNSLCFKFYTSSTQTSPRIFQSRPKNYHLPTWFPSTMQ